MQSLRSRLLAGTLMIATACGAAACAAAPAAPPAVSLRAAQGDPVQVDHAQVVASGEGEWTLHAAGIVPSSCHTPQVMVVPEHDEVRITLWSEEQAVYPCERRPHPFTVNVEFEAATSPPAVVLNGSLLPSTAG